MKLNSTFLRTVALFLAITIVSEVLFPSVAYALTDGPVSPEFSDFEPVASTDMVNNFTGDFSYNLPVVQIPGPEGSGYSMSLSYHSGVSSEQEASWVGYGWTLNPGSINRGVKGVPDDYKGGVDGDKITQYNKTPLSWSVTAQEKYNLEVTSQDQEGGTNKLGLSANFGKTYNNYSGMSKMWGLNLSGSNGDVSGSIGVQFSGRDPIFSINVQPADLLDKAKISLDKPMNKIKNKLKIDKEINTKSKLINSLFQQQDKGNKPDNSIGLKGDYNENIPQTVVYGMFTNGQANRMLNVSESHGFQFNYVNTNAVWAYLPIGFEFGINGTVSANANIPVKETDAYGYYYNSNPSNNFVSDYHVEKSTFYTRRLKYLGIPFSSPDNFMVSGEGLNGGFRLYADKIGSYFPNETESKTKIYNGGPAKGIGLPVQVSIGTELLGGSRKLKSRKTWHDDDDAFGGYKFDGDNSEYIFRFQNDLGGTVAYTDKIDVVSTSIDGAQGVNFVPGTRKMKPEYFNLGLYGDGLNKGEGVGRSAFIDKRINNNKFDGFSITNDQGVIYTYDEALKVRNEASIQTTIGEADPGDDYIKYKQIKVEAASGTVKNKPDYKATDYLVGEFKASPYNATYPLKSITNPDYIDIAPTGFGPEDLGGWTNFNYKKTYGGSGDWYRWRSPYNGLHYEQNTISEKKDDMGVVSYGEKEMSYLTSIETKTHIAFFITNKRMPTDFASYQSLIDSKHLTGSGIARKDGLSANPDEADASLNNVAGTQQLEMLEKIVLFAKDDYSKPVQVTYFKYNNSLCRKLPNSSSNTNSGYTSSGKLTLERVWSESQDIVNTRISPYIFKYEYKAQYAAEVNTTYPLITSYTLPYSGTAKENPDYAPQRLDRWGNNQYNGEQRFKEGKEWLYQGAYDASLLHDPAAWHLKQIILPSGGEIHIQYEEKDYQYVQDKRAMAMVSLDANNTVDRYNESNNKFYLKLSDIGVTSPGDIDLQKELISSELLGKYVYFKFLYALKGNNPSLDNCRSEYIDGYVTVNNVDKDANGVFLQLGESQSTFAFDEDERAVPKQVCYAYAITQRGGLINNNNCEPEVLNLKSFDQNIQDFYRGQVSSVADIKEEFPKYAGRTQGHRDDMRDMIKALKRYKYSTPDFSDVKSDQGDYCMSINCALSYIRVPMLKPKRGDGVRVKRLLMYDKGIESGDAALYGNEYFYQNEDGSSSGVATNEPTTGREENALVTLMERYKQSFVSRIIAGRNKLEFEGPVGESLLPPPSVGHSRVVIRNIHTGKSGGGCVEHTFYTCKDYPLSQDFTFNTSDNSELNGIKAIDKTTIKDNRKKDYLPLPLGLINITINKEWATQGYNFILYNIHGQPKSISTYGGGVYNPSVSLGSTAYPLISQVKYEFFEPGEKLKMMRPDGNYYLDTPGKEMDITMEMRSVKEKMFSPKLDFDVSVAIYPPQVNVGLGFGLSYTDALINTHVTSKVISYPVIQKKITSMVDGVVSVTENIGFSPENGKPLLTRTSDSYDQLLLAKSGGGSTPHNGSYYTLSVPACWIHNGFGPKATYGATNELTKVSASITTYGVDPLQLLGLEVSKENPSVAIGQTYSNKSYQNVITANVQTYSKSWFNTADVILNGEYFINGYPQPVKDVLNNRYRAKAQYVYRTDRTITDNIGNEPADSRRTYNSGMYNDFSLPDFTNACDNGSTPSCKWLKVSEITRYNPHGTAVEEKDIMNIYSTIKTGYKNTLLVMKAQNATYGSIAFRSFEDEISGTSILAAHSGKKSIFATAGTPITVLGTGTPYPLEKVSTNPFPKGAVFKMWLKEAGTAPFTIIGITLGGSWSDGLTQVAQTGEWKLYQVEIPASAFNDISGAFKVQLTPSLDLYIDDVRFEPYESASNCYAYDNMSRMITSFDDQHFGVYYQYDQEGKLVRKRIETEKGIMTVQENLQNVPTVLK